MSLDKFDLELENYTCEELENLFGLTFPYTDEIIKEKKINLSEVLIQNNTLGASHSQELIEFLNSAAIRLKEYRNKDLCESRDFMPSKIFLQSDYSESPFIEHSNSLINKKIENGSRNSYGKTSNDQRAPKGILNPINTHTITRLLNIDTQFRNNYYTTQSTNFLYNLPVKLERVMQITLQQAQLPISWYAISEANGNNKFKFKVAMPEILDIEGYDYFYKNPCVNIEDYTNSIIEKDILITIPDGNYYKNLGYDTYSGSIGYAINNAICEALKVPYHYPRIAFRSDEKTGKSTFLEQPVCYELECSLLNTEYIESRVPKPWSCNLPVGESIEFIDSIDCSANKQKMTKHTCHPVIRLLGVEFNIDNHEPLKNDYHNPLQLKFGWAIGYRVAEYIGNITSANLTPPNNWVKEAIPNKNVFTSEGIISIKGPAYAYLVIKDFNNNVNQGFIQPYADSVFPSTDIISKISLEDQDNKYGEMINVLGVTSIRTFFGPVDITKLKIQLLDEYGRVINLNNMDWTFTLSFTCVYDKT